MNQTSKLLSDIIFHGKYARYTESENRREIWDEAVDRNMQMHIQKAPQLKEEIEEVYNKFVRTKKVLPSMRALEDSTPIITKTGWKTAGEIKIGDILYSSEGKETKVLAVTKFEDKELFELTFSDGSSLTACDEHLWIISTLDDRKEDTTRVVDTKFIREHLTQGQSKYPKYNIAIWNPLPIERPEQELHIDPYVLGLWLGDGYSSGYQYSTSIEDSEHMSSAYNIAGYSTKHSTSSNIWTWSVRGLTKDLNKYGLKNNKHIPIEYLHSSVNQRIDLLAGLIDSDGHVTKEGRVSFANANKVLLQGTKELLSSLGISYIETVREEKGKHKECHTLLFFTDLVVSKLPRKANNLRESNSQRNKHRTVISVEASGRGNATCYLVDSPDHSFLAGRQMIVTHNCMQFAGQPISLNNSRVYNCAFLPIDHSDSFSEVMFLLLGGTGVGYSVRKEAVSKLPVVAGPKSRTKKYLIGDSIEGWADAVKMLVESYFYNKQNIKFSYDDIRKKGDRLVTSGGKAPGPQPLKDCIYQLTSILDNAIGRQLTTLEVHDMVCYIADAVLAGGIRRAALIALFSKGDMDMMTAKSGAWWELHPQRGRANNSVVLPRKVTTRSDFDELWRIVEASRAGEPGVYWTNDMEWGTNPCCEIALKPFQFCNLTEVNVSDVLDQNDLNERVRAAAFLGTLQASYTDFHYLRDIWRTTTEEDALIGVGMTGIASGAVLSLDLTASAQITREENERVAAILGINRAARLTTVKPSGTTSCLLGTSSGIHAWYSEYYIRTTRIGKTEAMYHYLNARVPRLLEDCLEKPHLQAVVNFPQMAPENSILRDENVLDFLNRVLKFNLEWVRAGHNEGENTNNVSATISVKDDEWEAVGDWMWENREFYNGLSVLPYDGGSYKQAPFQDCSKEVYEELAAYIEDANLNLGEVIEMEDNTDLTGELACAGGTCQIV